MAVANLEEKVHTLEQLTPLSDEDGLHLLSPRQEEMAYARVVLEIWRQAYVVLEAARASSASEYTNDVFLNAPFSYNRPVQMGISLCAKDLEEILSGQVPEGYDELATAQRILDVWLLSYDGRATRESWLHYARHLTQSAFGEVAAWLGNFPETVQRTRERVLGALPEVLSGAEIEEAVCSVA